MLLISDKIVQEMKIPQLYDTEEVESAEKQIYLKYMEKNTGWIWLLCEYDARQKLGFGYVIGMDKSWGYFSLEEMEAIYTIERDEEFVPVQFKELEL